MINFTEAGISPELIQPIKPVEIKPRPEIRKLSPGEITDAYESLGAMQSELPGEDPKLQLISSLGQPQEKFLGRLTTEHRRYTAESNEAGIKKLQRINYLRKLFLDEGGPDQGAAEVISRCYEHINALLTKAAEKYKDLAEKPRNPQIEMQTDKQRQLVTWLSSNHKNIERIFQTGYPKLWEKINSPEVEQAETIPAKPEFLSAEAWAAIYETGLNYLETANDNPDPKKKPEVSGYFYIDPNNPHLSPALRDIGLDQDKILAELGEKLRREKTFDAREKIGKEITRRRKETSWDNAMGPLRKILSRELADKIRHNETLSPADKTSLKDLIAPRLMQYPNEAEARAILEKLKTTEPDRALVLYSRNEAGQAVKVRLNKTSREIKSSPESITASRPDYGTDTKLVTIIGNRIYPKKLAELKNQ